MNCEHVKPDLSAYLDHELPAARISEISSHLLSCAACGAEHDALKHASFAFRALAPRPLPEGFLARLETRRRLDQPAAAPSFRFAPKQLAWAAAALMVGIVLSGPWRSQRLARAPGEALPATAAAPTTPAKAPASEPPAPLPDLLADTPKLGLAAPLPSLKKESGAGAGGAPYGEKPSYTNDQLNILLQSQSERLGLEAAPLDEEKRSEPFMGETLGHPGTRQQAEAAIRQMAALRRSVDEAAGKARIVPIAGSVAPLIGGVREESTGQGKAISPGEAIEDGFWSGDYASGNEGTRTVEREEDWKALWRSLSTSPAPAVDFSRSEVLAVFLGPRPTGGYSVEFVDFKRGPQALQARYREHTPPPGHSPPDGATSPYALKSIPRSDLPVRFEKVR